MHVFLENIIYLFLAASSLGCSMWALHGNTQASLQLRCTDSVVAVRAQLPHSMFLVPRLGIEPASLALEGGWTTREVPAFVFNIETSTIGEGNGNPLQCSFLENPWDRGAWWATVYGVARTESDTTEATQQQQQTLSY